MRKALFDTETTGLDPKDHRLVSIAAVILEDNEPTGDFFHFYLNPQRPVDPGAAKIHGLTDEFLKDKPTFAEVWPQIAKFLAGCSLVIHNAPFDVAFFEAEVRRVDPTRESMKGLTGITCTLAQARQLRGWGGKGYNTLDNLAREYKVQNLREKTGKHGALVDCLVLLGVYRALFGLAPRPLVDSEVEHYLDVIPGIYYVRQADFASLRTGSPRVPAGTKDRDVTPEVCDGLAGAGEDLLRAVAIPDTVDAGQPEPVEPAHGDRAGGGGAAGLDTTASLLAAVRRAGGA